MAQHDELISVLNEAISLEYTAAIRYNQSSTFLIGRDRHLFEDYFKDQAEEAIGHAKKWSDRIVYLGGTPKVDVQRPDQLTADTIQMLESLLQIEQRALDTYMRAHKVCQHQPTLYLLEDQIADEDRDVEYLTKLLGRVNIAQQLKRPAA